MEFKEGQPLFSFNYGGTPFSELEKTINKNEYLLSDGLKITTVIEEYKELDAFYIVNYFENTSDSDSKIISQLNDCDIDFKFEKDSPIRAGYSIPDNIVKIFTVEGSNVAHDEFNTKKNYILTGGEKKSYIPRGGRSSQGLAPFFDMNQGEKGIIAAIGWTGQWKAVFERSEDCINIKTGLETAEFKLYPHEKIRTSSALFLGYENGQNAGHNKFRRLIKEHYSIIGTADKPKIPPLSSMTWGGISTDKMLNRINHIADSNLGFEYYWIDAGWYGKYEGECPNEFTGNWSSHTGDWTVNKNYHPNGFKDVAGLLKEKNLKLLLWFEPERVLPETPTAKEHPEWFLKKEGNINWLLRLWDEEAFNDILNTLSQMISELGIFCLRQDFNIDPLEFWLENDSPERKGITEIKYITGLYRLWDTLNERFPQLIIDNCASGGRRIDIETLKRAIPLWRSDYQCIWDSDPETVQSHNTGISWWLPYSGTGGGTVIGDTYRFRSGYTAAFSVGFWMYDDWEFKEGEGIDWVKRQIAEYKSVREYLSCDYYDLIGSSVDERSWGGNPGHNPAIRTAGADDTSWAAWQYAKGDEGIIMAFRRVNSPFPVVRLDPRGIDEEKSYKFKDADSGEVFTMSGQTLIKDGFTITISEKRDSRLYYYNSEELA